MKMRIILCMMFFCRVSANAQTGKLTLQQSIDTALKNNFLTQQSQLLAKNAEINYRQAKYNRLPVAQGSFNYGDNNGRSLDPVTNLYINQQLISSNVNAQASVPIFSGGQLMNSIKQTEYAFETATMQWQQSKDELTLRVILAYLQILSNEDALVLAKKQADVSKQQVDRLDLMAQEGATPPANVSDLKGQYAGDELAIIAAENNLATSFLNLTELLNIPYDAIMDIDREGIDKTIQIYDAMPDEIYSSALQTLASVKASDARVKSSTAAVKVASSAHYPTVSLYGVLNSNYASTNQLTKNTGYDELPGNDYVVVGPDKLPVITRQNRFSSSNIAYLDQFNNNLSSGYGVSVNIPLFNAFRTKSRVSLAKNDEKNSQLIAANVKFLLRQSVDQAYVNITTTYKRYMILQEQTAAYAESFRIAGIRFENGVINAPEYLIAKNNVDRTNANIITTRYEYLLRSKVLDFYMGRLK